MTPLGSRVLWEAWADDESRTSLGGTPASDPA